MHEPNTNNSTHPPAAAAGHTFIGGAAAWRSKPPQPPLFIPPGHVAFRLLCHASRIGGLIGKSGSIIKQLQQLTNSKIRVEDPIDSSDQRIISVVSSPAIVNKIKLSGVVSKVEEENNGGTIIGDDGDEEWFNVSAVQEGVVRVFERVVEVAAEEDAGAGIEGVVSCRLLVWKNQAGAVIGKGGKVVEKIRKDTGCRIKVLTTEKFWPGSSAMDEIVEIEGDVLAVKKALVAVTDRLQELTLEKTRMDGTRPLEPESLPVPTMDPPLQQSPIVQQISSNSINHVSGSQSLESEKLPNMGSRTPRQEVSFKILFLNEQVGGIIGKGGSIIKALRNETGTFISVGPNVADCDERLITITAMESVESQFSPAQNAAVVVFNRSLESGLVKGLDSDSKGSPVSARVAVPANQVGCLLGKGGAIISEMRKVTGAGLRIIGGNQIPKCVPENHEVLVITGESVNVQDALYKVTARLRDNIFSNKMSTGSGNRNSWRMENSSYGKVRDPPQFEPHLSLGISDIINEHKSLTHSMDHLEISHNIDRSVSPTLLASRTVSGVNQGNIMDNGTRLPSAKGGVDLGSGSRSAIVTNATVEIVVPDNLIGSIYGENGSNLTRLRQISGAKVIVHEPRPGTTQRIVVISGTPDETQVAQSLLQAFILSESSQ